MLLSCLAEKNLDHYHVREKRKPTHIEVPMWGPESVQRGLIIKR